MNLLPVTIGAPGQLLLAGQRLLLAGPLQALCASRLGESCSGGLRAEHLRLAPPANRNLAAEVCHVEALGNELLLTCRLAEGAHLVQLRAEPQQAVVVGERVHLEVDPRGWRLFDAAGAALLPPPPGSDDPSLTSTAD